MAGFPEMGFTRRGMFALGPVSMGLAAGVAQAAPDRPGSSWIPSDAFQRDLPRLMRVAALPGLAIAVVDRGQLAWTRGFGVKNAVTGDPVNDETLFEAASMTKPVFAYVAMRLIEEGRLELDRPLVDYRRPDYLSDDRALSLITVRDVLRHSSGLPNWATGRLATIARPGSAYHYSGEAYVWLQLIVEQVSGMGLDAAMRAKLFDPAGMKRSTFGWTEAIAKDAVYGHDDEARLPAQPTRAAGDRLLPIAKRWGRPIASWTYDESVRAMREADPATPPSPHGLLINAAGGLLTTVSEYARFMALMMDGRSRAGWEISDASRRAMLTTELEIRGPDFTRGLGWQLEASPGRRLFEHSGSNYGIFRTLGVGDAASGRAIVIFTNGANGNLLAQRIVREATGLELLKFIA
ncbi:serine hydrolase domain-containing protein [Sphingomonas colocasiae]|uniref:Beta-lactamase family protein n=1 Tax=Sphingomonas colocasiae TaxID=1848973 RepID=A0ABS7PJK8_9SPHN|nr:serine hydrolase domain-containing protein [Sphingomonas colocasiae]MBY8821448.1 beta-lactamase family protein [Sphingomonas colocasiae]